MTQGRSIEGRADRPLSRTARRVRLRAGPFEVAFSVRTTRYLPAEAAAVTRPARPKLLPIAAASALVGALLAPRPDAPAWAAAALARPAAMVSAAVPDPVRATGTAIAARVAATPLARAVRPAAPAPAGEAPATAGGTRDPLSQAAAVRAALRTGEMQEWTDAAAGGHGFVVAGPMRAEAAGTCRELAVLFRPGDGSSRVENRRACLNAEPRRAAD